MIWYELVGWIGALLFIVAYLLLALKKISASKPLYHILNILGAICLMLHASELHDFPNLLVNSIWALIGIYAVLTILFERK